METQEQEQENPTEGAMQKLLDEMMHRPEPEAEIKQIERGFSLEVFKQLSDQYKILFRDERYRKPSSRLYGLVGARMQRLRVTTPNAVYAGQLIVICADNGLVAKRKGLSAVMIDYPPWSRDTLKSLVKAFSLK